MSDVIKSRKNARIISHDQMDSVFKSAPTLTRIWGRFLGFVSVIFALGLIGISVARTDTVAIVVGFLAAFALLIALVASFRNPKILF
jgi:hypothetical protein